MAAEYDDVSENIQREVCGFTDVNLAWLAHMPAAADVCAPRDAEARAIHAAVAGAQLMARGRADIGMSDALIGTYQGIGLLPR